jgi:hypothetical protein
MPRCWHRCGNWSGDEGSGDLRVRRRGPLFLKPGSYRKRRLRDAARMLPFLGVFLFAMPILWSGEGTPSEATARSGLYIFSVWVLLVLAAALMAPGLGNEIGREEEEEDGPSSAAKTGPGGTGEG